MLENFRNLEKLWKFGKIWERWKKFRNFEILWKFEKKIKICKSRNKNLEIGEEDGNLEKKVKIWRIFGNLEKLGNLGNKLEILTKN